MLFSKKIIAGKMMHSVVVPMGILLVFAGISAFVYFQTRSFLNIQTQNRHNDNLARAHYLTEKRFELYANTLRGIYGLKNITGSISFNSLEKFVKTDGLFEQYPGIFSILYVVKVSNSQKTALERQIQMDSQMPLKIRNSFQIFPQNSEAYSYVVKYATPLLGRERVLGLDYLSDPSRKQLITKALETGQPSISSILKSINTGKPIVLIALPIYTSETIPQSIEARKVNIEGFAVAVVTVSDIFNDLIQHDTSLSKINMIVRDTSPDQPPSGTILFGNEVDQAQVKNISYMKRSTDILGRKWSFETFISVEDMTLYERSMPIVLSMGILMVGIFCSITVRTLSLATYRAAKMASEITRDLHENEELFQAISDATGDAIIIMNSKDEVLFWNKAAEHMFGYTRKETIGKKLHPLITAGIDYKKYQSDVAHFGETGESFVLNKILVLEVKRKDGGTFPIELNISAIKIKDVWHAVGIARDISERSRLNKERDQYTTELERMNKMMVNRELKMVELKKQLKSLNQT